MTSSALNQRRSPMTSEQIQSSVGPRGQMLARFAKAHTTPLHQERYAMQVIVTVHAAKRATVVLSVPQTAPVETLFAKLVAALPAARACDLFFEGRRMPRSALLQDLAVGSLASIQACLPLRAGLGDDDDYYDDSEENKEEQKEEEGDADPVKKVQDPIEVAAAETPAQEQARPPQFEHRMVNDKETQNQYKVKKDMTFAELQENLSKAYDYDEDTKYSFLIIVAGEEKPIEVSDKAMVSEHVPVGVLLLYERKVIRDPVESMLRRLSFYQKETKANRREIMSNLQQEHKEFLTKLHGGELGTKADKHMFLSVLHAAQIDELFDQLARTKKRDLLHYLLKRNGLWNRIWEDVKPVSDPLMDDQIQLLRSKSTITLSEDELRDPQQQLIFDFLNQELVSFLWNTLSPSQLVQTLLNSCKSNEDRVKFFKSIQPESVSEFWSQLDDTVKQGLWSILSLEEKTDLLLEGNFLVLLQRQKRELWDLISELERVQLWTSWNEQESCFFATMSMLQVSKLWSALPDAQKSRLYSELTEQGNPQKVIQFFQHLTQKDKTLLMSRMGKRLRAALFKSLEIEGKLAVSNIVDAETKAELNQLLTYEEQRQMFFYSHFSMTEQTCENRDDFINRLVGDFQENNNQFVPFARVDGQYCQVIPHQQRSDIFITVQILKNTLKLDALDSEEREVRSTESVAGKYALKNDQMRVVHSRYGQMQEVEPIKVRQAERFAQISFVRNEYKLGFDCKHSFFVPEPYQFRCSDKSVQQHVLFKGRDGEMFLFFEEGSGGGEKDLLIGLINETPLSMGCGELSRATDSNLESFRIAKDTALYDFIKGGQFEMKKNNSPIYFLNGVPTLMKANGRTYVAFPHCSEQYTMGIYLHDIEANRTTCRFAACEVFIDFMEHPEEPNTGYFFFLTDRALAKRIGSGEMGANFGNWLSNDKQKSEHELVVLRVPVNLEEIKYEQNKVSDVLPLQEQEGAQSRFDLSCNAKSCFMPLRAIDDDEDQRWKDRYFRDCVVEVSTNKSHSEQGYFEEFTIIFMENFAETFKLQTDWKASSAKSADDADDADAGNKNDKGDKGGKQTAQEQVAVTQSFEEKMENKCFRSVYLVPGAQCLVHNPKNKMRGRPVTYVQTVPQIEQSIIDQLDEQGEFTDLDLRVHVHDLSEPKIRGRVQTTQVPPETKVKIKVRNSVLNALKESRPGSKYAPPQVNAIITPMSFTRQNIIAGAVLYQFTNAIMTVPDTRIEWTQSNPTNVSADQPPMRNMQPLMQKYAVDYPLLCYKSFTLDNRELVFVNLADCEYPQHVVNLFQLQFFTFVGHDHATREARIAFLAREQDKVKLCFLISCQPFEKKMRSDLVDFKIYEYEIEFKLPVWRYINFLQRVELVGSPETGSLLIQNRKNIYVSNNFTGATRRVTVDPMGALTLQRGFNDTFYYMEQQNNADVIKELTFEERDQKLEPQLLEIYQVNEGKVVALELDQETGLKMDSQYRYDRQLTKVKVQNQIYVIDDSATLTQLKQPEDGMSKYHVLKQDDLSVHRELNDSLSNLRKARGFMRICINHRTITIRGETHNLANGHLWGVQVKTHYEDTFYEGFERQVSLPLNPTQPDNATQRFNAPPGSMYTEELVEEDEQAIKKKKYDWKIMNLYNIAWSQRMIGQCYREVEQADGSVDQETGFYAKVQPSTRRMDIVGMRGMRDCESVNFVSDDLFLFKFRSASRTGMQDYWSIIDRYGQIRHMNQLAKRNLRWDTFACGDSQQMSHGCYICVKGGSHQILSEEADAVYEERHVNVIEFNRQGEAINEVIYHRDEYMKQLTHQVHQELEKRSSLFERHSMLANNSEKLLEVANDIQISENVIISTECDVYRIGAVYEPNFTDDVAVNRISSQQSDEESQRCWSDKVFIGIIMIKPALVESETADLEGVRKNEKCLKIMLFLCKTEEDRKSLLGSGFTLCGDYLCWKYHDQQEVHTLNMKTINEITEEKLHSRSFMGALKNPFDQFSMLKRNMTSMFRRPSQEAAAAAQVDPGDDDFKRQRDDPTQSASANKVFAIQVDDDNDDDYQRAPISSPINSRMELGDVAEPKHLLLPNQMTTYDLETSIASVEDQDEQKPVETEDESQMAMVKMTTVEEEVRQQRVSVIWSHQQTRTINIEDMIDTDAEIPNCMIADVPKSTLLSIRRSTDDAGNEHLGIRHQLLQVTVANRTMVFELSEKLEPDEVFFFNATQQFIDADRYVESGVRMAHCYEDERLGFMTDVMIANRPRDYFIHKIKRKFQDGALLPQEDDLRTPVFGGVFTLHAEADIFELERIGSIIRQQRKLESIDLQTMTCVFEGHTLFSIFADETKLHEQAVEQVKETTFPNEQDIDEQDLQHHFLRRLFRILCLPTPDLVNEKHSIAQEENYIRTQDTILGSKSVLHGAENLPDFNGLQMAREPEMTEEEINEEKQSEQTQEDQDLTKKLGLRSILQKSLFIEQVRIKDCLIAIANISEECSISSFATNIDDFIQMINGMSGAILELIQDSVTPTKFTHKITNSAWSSDRSLVTFRSKALSINQEECARVVRKKLDEDGVEESAIMNSPVELKVLDLDWMFRDKQNFINFVQVLTESENDAIYNTELINTLLEEFWDENYYRIFRKCFLPFMAYLVGTLSFFMLVLRPEFQEDASVWGHLLKYSLGLLVIALWYVQVRIEGQQLRRSGFIEYIQSFNNIMDVFQYVTNLVIVVIQLLNLPIPSVDIQREVAAFSSFFIWVKVLDWLRLFGPTSFYYKLIVDTLQSIWAFMIIFIIALAMFGVPLQILNFNRDADNQLYEEIFPGQYSRLLNVLMNQYMLALGEFSIDNFSGYPQQYLLWVMFLLATFLTQLTFLNMLVAIMGDTFECVMENQQTFATETKIAIMGDYTSVIQDDEPAQIEERYLFVMTPALNQDDEGASGAWEGKIKQVKRVMEKNFKKVNDQVEHVLKTVTNQNYDSKQRDTAHGKELKAQYLKTMDKFELLYQHVSALKKGQVKIQGELKASLSHAEKANVREFNQQVDSLQEGILERQGNKFATMTEKVTGELSSLKASSYVNVEKQISDLEALLSQIQEQLAERLRRDLQEGGEAQQEVEVALKAKLKEIQDKQKSLTQALQQVQRSMGQVVKKEVTAQNEQLQGKMATLQTSQASAQATMEAAVLALVKDYVAGMFGQLITTESERQARDLAAGQQLQEKIAAQREEINALKNDKASLEQQLEEQANQVEAHDGGGDDPQADEVVPEDDEE